MAGLGRADGALRAVPAVLLVPFVNVALYSIHPYSPTTIGRRG